MSRAQVPASCDDLSDPAWDIAELFPAQGDWSVGEYLRLKGNRLIEFDHGRIDVLDMPTDFHQAIVGVLYSMLLGFITPRQLGEVRFAPLRVRLWKGRYREPDVMFMLRANVARIRKKFWIGADLLMEVVSEDDRRRDLKTKRLEYARAGVREYWIVDPKLEQITVLKLAEKYYELHGEFRRGQRATSLLLPGFEVDANAVFDVGLQLHQTK